MRPNRSLPHDVRVVRKSLVLVGALAVILGAAIYVWLTATFPLPSNTAAREPYLEHYVDLIEVIAVGIVVALVAVVIPLMLPEARDRFERYKESRLAYSRAKTAVIYLPDKVLTVDREQALKLVEEAHRELHLAETYEDVIIDRGYLNWFSNPKLWILYNYWQIVAVAKSLRRADVEHDSEEARRRLTNALREVHDRFGVRGEKCEGEKWDLADGSRFKHEDALERLIEAALEGRTLASSEPVPA